MSTSLITPAAGAPLRPPIAPIAPNSTETREVRFHAGEVRSKEDTNGNRYITGYAAVFNSLSGDFGGWREIIRPGAFKNVLASGVAIYHRISHNKMYLLGNTESGTTQLWEDEFGLAFKTLCGTRSYELDLLQSIERGDVKHNSFAFKVGKAGQRWSRPANESYELREITDFSAVIEFSTLLEAPAYDATNVELSFRSLFPAGVPEELRSHMEAASVTLPAPASEAKEEVIQPQADAADGGGEDGAESDKCMCDCEACQSGACSMCSDPNCSDPNCGDGSEGEMSAGSGAPVVLENVTGEINGGTTTVVPGASAPVAPDPPFTFADKRLMALNRARMFTKARARIAAMKQRDPELGLMPAELRAEPDKTEGMLTLYLYGDIGEDMCGDGISTKSIRSAIEAFGLNNLKLLKLRINSPGGDAFEGVTIGNYLKSLGVPIEVWVDGLAASAASVIAMCGTRGRVHMCPNAMLMIHNASSAAYGTAEEMMKVAGVLSKISAAIANTYIRRTGKSKQEIGDLLGAESWIDAEEAVAENFADMVADPADATSAAAQRSAMRSLRESRALDGLPGAPVEFRALVDSFPDDDDEDEDDDDGDGDYVSNDAVLASIDARLRLARAGF